MASAQHRQGRLPASRARYHTVASSAHHRSRDAGERTDTLHEAAEAMMVLSALHANRVTVTLDDLHSLQRLKRPDIRTTKGPPPQALGAVVRAKQLEERTSRGPGDVCCAVRKRRVRISVNEVMKSIRPLNIVYASYLAGLKIGWCPMSTAVSEV